MPDDSPCCSMSDTGSQRAPLLFFSEVRAFTLGCQRRYGRRSHRTTFTKCAAGLPRRWPTWQRLRIDAGIYDRVQPLRAPNSRHPKTGLHKTVLTLDELRHRLVQFLNEHKSAIPFDLPAL